MKNKALLFAGSLVLLAACNTNTDKNGYTQEQVDSMVNARLDEERMKMMIENDSIINAMAQWKADSIIAAMKGGKVTTRTTSSSTTTTTTAPVTPKNPKDDRFNGQGTSNTIEKESRFDKEAAEKLKEENTKKKAERFK